MMSHDARSPEETLFDLAAGGSVPIRGLERVNARAVSRIARRRDGKRPKLAGERRTRIMWPGILSSGDSQERAPEALRVPAPLNRLRVHEGLLAGGAALSYQADGLLPPARDRANANDTGRAL